MKDLPVLPFATEEDWEQWLEEHHSTSQGLWLKLAKKGSGITSISYQQALDIALCFGWIDGQKNSFDETYWLQKFTPRRKRSPWSRINREKATTLIEQGRMRPAGLQEVERAKTDGRWDAAYASQSQIEMPEDLQSALDASPQARAFFEQLNSANRYAILYRVTTAKKAETRQRRIAQFIEMLEQGRKLY